MGIETTSRWVNPDTEKGLTMMCKMMLSGKLEPDYKRIEYEASMGGIINDLIDLEITPEQLREWLKPHLAKLEKKLT